MVYSHFDGYERQLRFRKIYGYEIELLCANSHGGEELDKVQKMMVVYKDLQSQFPENVIVKESEAHEDKAPYFEASVFCFKDEISDFIQKLLDLGIGIDIIHDHDHNQSSDYNG